MGCACHSRFILVACQSQKVSSTSGSAAFVTVVRQNRNTGFSVFGLRWRKNSILLVAAAVAAAGGGGAAAAGAGGGAGGGAAAPLFLERMMFAVGVLLIVVVIVPLG